MKKRFFSILVFVVVLAPFYARAEGWTPFQFAIWPPAQLFSETRDVYGLRLNFPYGKNQNISGLDAGIFNTTVDQQNGMQLGIFNFSGTVRGMNLGLVNYCNGMAGFQAGIVNHSQHDAQGVQISAIMNNCEELRGLQMHVGIFGNTANHVRGGQLELSIPLLGFNYADSVDGIQVAVLGFNNVGTTVRGAQIALYNSADTVHGVQIGFLNLAKNMTGVQIGLINSIYNQKLPFMPFFNIGF